NTIGLKKEKIVLGKFDWNFGDGRQKQLSVSDPFTYVYDYPGEYVVTLSYSDSNFDTKPDATDRLTIKVIPSGVIISSVGTYNDSFVELENKSNYEMSISGWILKGSVHTFMIPEGTVILPNKKLKLSPKITGFDFNDLSSLSIIDTSGQVFATYPNYTKSAIKYSSSNTSQENIVKSDIVESNQAKDIGGNGDVINLNDLGASAAGVKDIGFNNKTLVYLGLIGIIIIGALGIILLRHKQEIPDYEEKGITANDMKILE
ncbi:lamin tail domain-containing protein, partial [Candidatus Nomurabacteria bacterium]|nr:lamin tail domain-containing protein [Candidatus Nomurabacteria bacterium]